MPSHCSTMFHRWCCMLWSWAVPSLLHTCFFLSFWYRLILIPAFLLQKWSVCLFFRCFLEKSNLHLVVNPLYLLSWSLLLIVDFDTRTSWRVFFTWLDVVKGMERILRSPTTVVLRGRPWLFMLLSSPVHSFFLQINQIVLTTPNVPAIYLMDLFCSWSLTDSLAWKLESSFDCMMWVHSNSFQMKIAHLESTPDHLPA